MLGSETTTQEILKGLQQSLLRNIDYKFLPYEFNMQDMPRKELLDNDLTFTKVGWVYHFNAIPQQFGLPEQWMEKTYKELYSN